MEWKEVKLGDVCEVIMGQSPKNDTYNNDGLGLPLLNGPSEFGYSYPSAIQWTTDSKREAQQFDIMFCVRGSTTGKMNWADQTYSIGRGLAAIRHKEGKEYRHFAKALLDVYLPNLLALSNGSTFPCVTGDMIRDQEVYVPSLTSQKNIASILSSLDSKIETNNKINAKLEEMAQALFKSWFVDFEPFKENGMVESELGMIPKGWRVDSLTGVANYRNGAAMQNCRPKDENESYPVLKIKELGQGFCDSSSERCTISIPKEITVNNGDVIFSWSGTLLVDLWCGGICGLNQHLFKVTSKDYPKWFYYYWTKHHLNNFIHIAKDKAVTMGHIKRGHLENAKVVVPNIEDMQQATGVFQPLVDRMISLRVENTRLSILRDTLLPKLMSGEIEV